MEGLTSAILILGVFAFTALAQSEQLMRDRHNVLASWLVTVRAAETKYKGVYGVYGDLAALRDPHLLDALIFEADKPTKTEPDTTLVLKSTHFEVTAPSDGKHYKVSICEVFEESNMESSICGYADEMSTGFSKGRRQPLGAPPLKEGQ